MFSFLSLACFVFPMDDSVYINCESMVCKKKRRLELERKRCHGVTAKLMDYEFTMVPATQFVSGSGI